MNLKIKRDDLLPVLRLASKVTDRSGKVPIMACVHLLCSEDCATVSATNLEVTLTSDVPCQVKDAGGIAIDCGTLLRITSGSSDELVIRTVRDGWAEVTTGKQRHKLPHMPARDYPKITKYSGKWITVPASALVGVLERATYCVAPLVDEARGALRGVIFDSDGSDTTVMAIDGHRGVRLSAPGVKLPKLRTSIVPHGIELATQVAHDADDVLMAFAERRMFIRSGSTMIGAAEMTGALMPREALFGLFTSAQSNSKVTVIVDRDALVAAAKRCAPLTDAEHGLVLAIDAESVVVRSHRDGSEIEDTITAESTGTLAIGVVAKYLIQALQLLNHETATLKLGGPLDPILVTSDHDPDYTAIVMPIRID